jgi:hypothetical protein
MRSIVASSRTNRTFIVRITKVLRLAEGVARGSSGKAGVDAALTTPRAEPQTEPVEWR